MSEWNFWESQVKNSARKVLVIPNITNSSNLEKDSFVHVLLNHITALDKLGDYFWHVIMPNATKSLNLPNVKQHIIPISGDMIHMRTSFPVKIVSLMEKLDFDVVYSHLPDWYMIKRYTDKPVIGYAHWWELKSCNAEDRKNHLRNIGAEILGVLQMEVCYLNTQDQKNRVLAEAAGLFNKETLDRLDKILQVWNLGVPEDKIIDKPTEKEKIIVFNHRAAAYKGYPAFIKLMAEYWETRKDFTVWVPQLNEKPEYPWIDATKLPKHDYYKRLQQCAVGVQMRQTNYGWSVSATDCMMNGTAVIFQEADCYREIDPNGIFFRYKKDLFSALDSFLDDVIFRQEQGMRSIGRALALWSNETLMIAKLHDKLNGN